MLRLRTKGQTENDPEYKQTIDYLKEIEQEESRRRGARPSASLSMQKINERNARINNVDYTRSVKEKELRHYAEQQSGVVQVENPFAHQ